VNKRRNFVIGSIALGFIFLLTKIIWPDALYWQPLLIAVMSLLVSWLLFGPELKSGKNVLIIAILPSMFSLGVTLFLPLIVESVLGNILVSLLLIVIFYLMCLISNVFVVSLQFKTVPLYRAASTSNTVLLLLAGFLIFNTIFSLKYSPWLNGLLVLLISFPIFYNLFWVAAISESRDKKIFACSVVCSCVLSEFAVAISFWPAGLTLSSLYLVSLIYVLGGIIQAQIKERLFRRTFLEYIWIGAGTFIALFLSVNF